MRIIKPTYIIVTALIFFAACDKKDKLQYFKNGTPPQLLVDAGAVAANIADSNSNVLNIRWSRPNYSTDSNDVKFVVQIDSLGKNFSNPIERTLIARYSYDFTAKELNQELLSKGYRFERELSMQVRVVSSYLNNNDPLQSNVVQVQMTAYRPPPQVPLPPTSRLFIVGDASTFGWTNDPTPAFPSSRELTRINATTWVGLFNFVGGGAYKFLYAQGDWDSQYHLTSGDATSGTFQQRNSEPAFRGPATAGWYRVTLDMQFGSFLVEPFTQQYGVPDSLFIMGNATPAGLANPVPEPAQRFIKVTSTRFVLPSIRLEANRFYTLIPQNGVLTRKFGRTTASGNSSTAGNFAPEGGDFISPPDTDDYRIIIDFRNNSYELIRL